MGIGKNVNNLLNKCQKNQFSFILENSPDQGRLFPACCVVWLAWEEEVEKTGLNETTKWALRNTLVIEFLKAEGYSQNR